MSSLSLGDLSMQLKIDMDDLDASVKKAVGGLDRIEQKADQTAAAAKNLESSVEEVAAGIRSMGRVADEASKKTEDIGKVLKKALMGEVLVNAVNRVSSSLQQMGDEFKGLGTVVQGTGAIMQGLFQGNILGAGIAAAGVGVSALVNSWSEAEAAAKAAEEASMKAFGAHLDRMKALNEQIAEVSTQVRGAILAAAGGKDVAAGARAIGAGDAAKREGQLAIERMDVGAQFGSANARLEKLKAAPTYAPGFQAQQIAEQQAVVDGLLTRMRELDQQLDEAAGASNLIAAQEVLAKVTKDATKPLSDFAKAMKEAREWTLGKAGLTQSPGEAAREATAKSARMNLGSMHDPDGSISTEARKRAERNEGYKHGALLVLDKPLSRLAHVFDDAAVMISDGAAEFAQEMADVAGSAAQRLWEMVAPKTLNLAKALSPTEFNPGEAIAQALSHSIEFQAVGKALDSGLVEIVNAITEVLRPAVPVITMAIRAVVEAAKIVMGIVDIVASALQLDTVFAIVFEAVKLLAALLSAGAFAIKYALDGLQNALKNAAIGLLSIAGDLFKTQIDDLRASLVTQGDFLSGMGKAFDDVMKIGFNAEIAAVGMADAADAANKVAASFLNLPAGFKTAAAIYGATSASGAPFGGFAPPSVSPGMPGVAPSVSGASSPSGGGDVLNFYGPINIEGDEGLKVGAKRAARQRGMSGNGTTGGRESEPGAWDGVWDLTP